jgi:hypothetical protein
MDFSTLIAIARTHILAAGMLTGSSGAETQFSHALQHASTFLVSVVVEVCHGGLQDGLHRRGSRDVVTLT